MVHLLRRRWQLTAPFAVFVLLASAPASHAQLFINEIFFDPPSGGDSDTEFIELRGEPNAPLDDTFLLFLESERSSTDPDNIGGVDNVFDLRQFSLGSNGFLTIRQQFTPLPDPAPGTTDLVNSGVIDFGEIQLPSIGFGSGPSSTVGASDDGDDGETENGGFSAFLVRSNSPSIVPTIDDDFDVDNDGNLDDAFFENFTVIDSIGQAEPNEVNPAFFAAINFASNGNESATVSEGGQIVFLDFEVEVLARFGNSTGSEPGDFLVTNVTNDQNSGALSNGATDFRVSSSDPQPEAGTGGDENGDGVVDDPPGPLAPGVFIEANLPNIPFGLPIFDNLGAPNFLTGDFNRDGQVDIADFTVWRDNLGLIRTQTDPLGADHNGDFIVDVLDFELFLENFGFGVPGFDATTSPAAAAVIPEPSGLLLALVTLPGFAQRRRRFADC